MDFIKEKINEIAKVSTNIDNKAITNERAFTYWVGQLLILNKRELSDTDYGLIRDSYYVDGANDGGIDLIAYDENNQRIKVIQTKYSSNINKTTAVSELRKTLHTISSFLDSKTSAFSDTLKRKFTTEMDQVPEDFDPNFDIYFVSLSDSLQIDRVKDELDSDIQSFNHSNISINFINRKDLGRISQKIQTDLRKIKYFSFDIDYHSGKNSQLVYNDDIHELTGYFVSLSSNSLIKAFDKYKDAGLFDMNLREYFKNNKVDRGIVNTLFKHPERFWFLNNGITIACDDCKIDGDTVKLYNFSIINGGQTTNIIGQNSAKINKEFYIPTKIVKIDAKLDDNDTLFSDIAQASNSQKPIRAQDLRSNDRVMIGLRERLQKYNIDMNIKRGVSQSRSSSLIKIKNDQLAQIIYSFVNQQPGTARSAKNSLFSTDRIYNKIFIDPKYLKSENGNEILFLSDLIKFWNDFDNIISEMTKNEEELNESERDIARNGELTIFAIFGVYYRIANDDYTFNEILHSDDILKTDPYLENKFSYDGFYGRDKSIDPQISQRTLIKAVVNKLQGEYARAVNDGTATSVSNFFKRDTTYRNPIIPSIIGSYSQMGQFGIEGFKQSTKFLLR